MLISSIFIPIWLNVYDVEQRKVLSQVEVGRKENEITKVPKALECVEIAQKVVTGDTMHTQKALSAQIVRQGEGYIFPVKENQLSLYKNIQQSMRQNIRRQDFERSRQISLPSRKSTKDMGALKTYPDHQ